MSMHDQNSNGGTSEEWEAGAEAPVETGAVDPTAPGLELVEDGRAQQALDFVKEVVSKMGMSVDVSLMDGATPMEIQLDIQGPDSARIIGKKGQVLAALQYLANRVVNRPGLDRRYVIVDAEGYYAKREETLASMAKRLGAKAMTEGKIITFEPMSARDRRIVHMALSDLEGVVTKSDGEGENRRVQIVPVRR